MDTVPRITLWRNNLKDIWFYFYKFTFVSLFFCENQLFRKREKKKMGKKKKSSVGSKKVHKASGGRRAGSKKSRRSHHKRSSPIGRNASGGIFDELNDGKTKKICVLRHGESMLLSNDISELEIVLYRPLEPPRPIVNGVPETFDGDEKKLAPLPSEKKTDVPSSTAVSEEGVSVTEEGRKENGSSASSPNVPLLKSKFSTRSLPQGEEKNNSSDSRWESGDTEIGERKTDLKGIGQKNHQSAKSSPVHLPQDHFGSAMTSPVNKSGAHASTENFSSMVRGDGLLAQPHYREESSNLPGRNEMAGSEGETQLLDPLPPSFPSETNKDNLDDDERNSAKTSPALPSHPLFFDTTACVFVDPKNLRKANYVATGRSATDHKDMVHIPHAVTTGKEPPTPGFYTRINMNISENEPAISERQIELMLSFGAIEESDVDSLIVSSTPPLTFAPLAFLNGPVKMAAADGVQLHLKHLQHAAGALVSCSLFDNRNIALPPDWGVYFLVRAKVPSPFICLIPVLAFQGNDTSQISIMLRRIRVGEEHSWELISMAEFLPCCDVPGVLLSMQNRGLGDVSNYNPSYRTPWTEEEGNSDNDSLSASSEIEEEGSKEEEEEVGEKAEIVGKDVKELSNTKIGRSPSSQADVLEKVISAVPSGGGVVNSFPFEQLLDNLPLVVREGRRQYSEGVTNANSMLDEDAFSGEDEVMEDALKAAFPRFAHGHPIRYADGTYNNGSQPTALSSLYTSSRAKYAIERASRKAPFHSRDRLLVTSSPLNAEARRLLRLEDKEEVSLPPPWDVVVGAIPTPVAGSRHSAKSSGSKKSKKKKRSGSSKKKKGKKGKKKSSGRSGSRGKRNSRHKSKNRSN